MTSLLTIVVIVLGIALIGKILNVFELSADLRGTDFNEVTTKDNRTQSILMLLFGLGFLAWVTYQFVVYGQMILPEAASEHGLVVDNLMSITMGIIITMFFITHGLLIYFAFRYYSKKGRKATFFAHSTKLELIWTIVPTVVLTSLIIYGISTWNKTMGPAPEESMVVELYAKQFDWTARYAGEDNQLGASGYRMIDGSNVMGIDLADEKAHDDKIVRGEIHLPIGKSVLFKFNSRDVIHSAYMPHFRAQMNCVPGMVTQFHFVPNKTTAEMQSELNNPDFQYILLCNKICGSAHYNMQMDIIVESEEDFQAWLKEKKTVADELGTEPASEQAEVISVKEENTEVNS